MPAFSLLVTRGSSLNCFSSSWRTAPASCASASPSPGFAWKSGSIPHNQSPVRRNTGSKSLRPCWSANCTPRSDLRPPDCRRGLGRADKKGRAVDKVGPQRTSPGACFAGLGKPVPLATAGARSPSDSHLHHFALRREVGLRLCRVRPQIVPHLQGHPVQLRQIARR